MSEIGLAIGALVLFFVLGHLRRARIASSILSRWDETDRVTLDDLSSRIAELAPSLRETEKVTAPQTAPERGHIWSSPCGKRVYIN